MLQWGFRWCFILFLNVLGFFSCFTTFETVVLYAVVKCFIVWFDYVLLSSVLKHFYVKTETTSSICSRFDLFCLQPKQTTQKYWQGQGHSLGTHWFVSRKIGVAKILARANICHKVTFPQFWSWLANFSVKQQSIIYFNFITAFTFSNWPDRVLEDIVIITPPVS